MSTDASTNLQYGFIRSKNKEKLKQKLFSFNQDKIQFAYFGDLKIKMYFKFSSWRLFFEVIVRYFSNFQKEK